MMLKSLIACCLYFSLVLSHPWDPVARTDKVWVDLHKKFLETTKNHGKDINIVFYGASIMQFWRSTGKKVWDQYYGNLHAVDYGISGDRTENLVYRIGSGEVANLHPKVVVVIAGSNNLGSDKVEDIAKGVKTIIDLLRLKLPNVKILNLAALPRTDRNGEIKQFNDLISKFNYTNSYKFLNMNSHFENAKGVHKDLYVSDERHLSEKGYKVWAEVMDPVLKQLLK